MINGQEETICDGGFNDGLTYGIDLFLINFLYHIKLFLIDSYHGTCKYYHPWMISAISGAFVVLYSSVLEFFAMCGCLQGKAFFQNNCLGARCKKTVEWFGGSLLTFFTGKY